MTLIATIDYDEAWADLNRRLRALEHGEGGLVAALAALGHQQRDSGFIQDGLEGVERYTFPHPDMPQRFFRVQYNPKRALRFKGAGRAEPPEGVEPVNGGCFLCRENIRWQQGGAQLGYEITLAGTPYIGWMNPFPLLPMHVVFASAAHMPQEWIFGRNGDGGPSGLLAEFLELADRLPGLFGYFNGVDSGASIPHHLHFHFCRRPPGAPDFPLELASRRSRGRNGSARLISHYPLAGARWRGTRDHVLAAATDWIAQWADENADRLASLTANLIAAKDPKGDALSFYFIPRTRQNSHSTRTSDHIGALEVLGEFVFSTDEDKRLLDQGGVDYFSIETWLAEVGTPLT